jgi:hypothetical protein
MLGHASSDVFFITELDDPAGITGVRLEALTHGDLPFRGPGRSSQGTWSVLEFELFAARPPQLSGGEGQGRAIAAPGESEPAWEKLALVGATADWSEPEQKRDDGKKSSGPVSFLIDGSDDRWWQADRGRGQRNQSSAAVVRFEHPLDLPRGSKLKFVLRMGDMVGCCRLSVTRSPDPQAAPVAHDALLAMAVSAAERDERQRQAVFDAWRRTLPEDQSLARAFAAAWQRYPAALTSVLHLAEREPQNARQTYLLERGEWDKPLRAITPHTPAFLHPLPVELAASPEPPRLVFARWLASSSSPLTARVAVNRIWQAIFGEGLVETSEDFGTRAAVPEHLELLDSLAVEFMQQGWSQKHLIKTIVSSQTYQQDSRTSPSQLDVDPRNRWLTRGPRFRVEAEVVRDIALSTSGLITFAMGGPSVIPPVPQNVLDYNYTYPTYWTPAEGAERYRRTVYGFRKRSMPDPVMANFDGPNGDTACARRVRSNTPLAALTTLNEAIFVESARALALRVLREAEESDAARMDYAFRLCTSRRPTLAERAELLKLLASRRQKIAEGWLNPREITTGSSATLPTLPQAITPQDAAAWTIVSRVLLNLDETLTKN